MVKRSKEGEPVLTIRDVYDRLQGIGYQPVAIPDTPRGLAVFQAPDRIRGLRRLGTVVSRCYALYSMNDEGTKYVIGWSHPVWRKMDELTNTGDPAQLAAQNCLGRLTFLESCPDIEKSYLEKIVGKFADSISAQSLTRPENS